MTSVQPQHLASLSEIAKVFKKRKTTIKQWHKENAPIVFDGCTYSAEYNALQSWLLEKYASKK